FRLTKYWLGPLLVVPAEAEYGTIGRMVFAWGYGLDLSFSLSILMEFVSFFSPFLHILHLTAPSDNTSPAQYEALRESIACDLRPGIKMFFEQQISDHPVNGLE